MTKMARMSVWTSWSTCSVIDLRTNCVVLEMFTMSSRFSAMQKMVYSMPTIVKIRWKR